MEPGEEIKALCGELEDIIAEAKSPLTGGGKKIVDPEASATSQADSIIADAQQQAMILAGDQEVVRLANQQADEIRDQAQQYERDLRYHINDYAEGVITGIEDNLKSVIGQLERSRQALSDGNGTRR